MESNQRKAELKLTYIENIDDWAETQLQESLDEGADDWTPHHTLHYSFWDALTALQPNAKFERESDKNEKKKQHP